MHSIGYRHQRRPSPRSILRGVEAVGAEGVGGVVKETPGRDIVVGRRIAHFDLVAGQRVRYISLSLL